MTRSATMLLACALAMSVAGGCARPRPSLEPEVPPLAVPLPPPRVLPPLDGGPIEAAGRLAPEPPPQRPPARPAPEARRVGESARAEPRPEVTRPDMSGELPAEPSGPAPALQLAPAADVPRVEQGIRVQLQRAATDLNRIDYQALNADARMQYDTAKRFMILSEQAIRDRNLIYAQTLADKARVIAGVLLGR